jgi:hypothetical protein
MTEVYVLSPTQSCHESKNYFRRSRPFSTVARASQPRGGHHRHGSGNWSSTVSTRRGWAGWCWNERRRMSKRRSRSRWIRPLRPIHLWQRHITMAPGATLTVIGIADRLTSCHAECDWRRAIPSSTPTIRSGQAMRLLQSRLCQYHHVDVAAVFEVAEFQ